jgi:hypothetical protein
MPTFRSPAILLAVALLSSVAHAETSKAKAPPPVAGTDGLKNYLLSSLKDIQQASADLKVSATEYRALVTQNDNSPEEAAKAKPEQVAALIKKMRDAYGRIDSFGYEYIEGIVAGVPSLAKFDVELDSGVPAKGAAADAAVADVKIKAGDLTIDKEGSLNNWLIEATVFGTNPRFTKGSAKLPGFSEAVNLPNADLVGALADYAVAAYARLGKEAEAWKPSDRDCFQVLATMTPTLADYFEEWKESKKGTTAGGRFVAVTRLSDMRGIMSSTRLTWLAVQAKVGTKDQALSKKISEGYDKILSFIDTLEQRDKKTPLTVESIDALGTEAKELADKLTVQAVQAAALLGIEVNTK